MNRILRAGVLMMALAAAACGGERAADETGAAAPADSAAAPADTSLVPLEPGGGGFPVETPVDSTAAPVEPAGPSRPLPAGQRYADCMAKARQAPEGERELLEGTCRNLPDAPR